MHSPAQTWECPLLLLPLALLVRASGKENCHGQKGEHLVQLVKSWHPGKVAFLPGQSPALCVLPGKGIPDHGDRQQQRLPRGKWARCRGERVLWVRLAYGGKTPPIALERSQQRAPECTVMFPKWAAWKTPEVKQNSVFAGGSPPQSVFEPQWQRAAKDLQTTAKGSLHFPGRLDKY